MLPLATKAQSYLGDSLLRSAKVQTVIDHDTLWLPYPVISIYKDSSVTIGISQKYIDSIHHERDSLILKTKYKMIFMTDDKSEDDSKKFLNGYYNEDFKKKQQIIKHLLEVKGVEYDYLDLLMGGGDFINFVVKWATINIFGVLGKISLYQFLLPGEKRN